MKFVIPVSLILTFLVASLAAYHDKTEFARLSGASDAPEKLFIATVNILNGDDAATATHLCQGVIIAPNMTLTAASCLIDMTTFKFYEDKKLFVMAGDMDKTVVDKAVGVTKSIIYPGFHYYPNSMQFGQDLALLIPATNFMIDRGDLSQQKSLLDKTIAVVPMAKKSTNNTKDAHLKDAAYLASWGNIGDGNGAPIPGPNELQFVVTSVKKQEDCTKYFLTHNAKPFELQSSSVCLDSAAGMGSCKGDAGAGMFIKDLKSNVTYLAGIVSEQVTGKCPPEHTTVVTRVAPYLIWINKNGGPKPIS